ncbi:hypothetical protein A3SI_16607 [Nitritalea halalkaliphila LW7]|uniref:PepSY-associated TM helix domain-containing protein n=1 Tax=Nitritalea halalkaliphila LW7 TaxID=1189621 RepID=I5BWY8_9BACT|nr:PepSY domain-containing protein [Nitritalea halalkaliphila]EIM74090.1 hypothetical protein A3SI_16607 [Nitritalea halalkaliphila LW7]
MAHWFKPEIAKTFLIPTPIPEEKVQLSPQEALETNGITSFKNLRLVQWEEQVYYQVKDDQAQLVYIDAQNGALKENGDRLYAEYLARIFLDDPSSPVKNAVIQEEFDDQYKYINRLLPVWKLDFDRPDAMTLYVETLSDRLGTFNPRSRKAFIWFFSFFHNWSWLESITNLHVRTTVMLLFLGLITASALAGLLIYGFMWKRFSSPRPENKRGLLRQYHRQIGLATAFVTLTFAFSGGYQATAKYTPNTLPEMRVEPSIRTADLMVPLQELDLAKGSLVNFEVVQMQGETFYQVHKHEGRENPLRYAYYAASSGGQLEDGDTQYAQFLADTFAEKLGLNLRTSALQSQEVLRTFDHEYGFIFKRLPVHKLAFTTPNAQTLYIETGTSRLAASIANADRVRGFSFAVLHKFFFMDWAGKTVRDLVMLVSALGVLVVSLFGLALFVKQNSLF